MLKPTNAEVPLELTRTFYVNQPMSSTRGCPKVMPHRTRILSEWHVWIFNGQHQDRNRNPAWRLNFSTEIFRTQNHTQTGVRKNFSIIFHRRKSMETCWGGSYSCGSVGPSSFFDCLHVISCIFNASHENTSGQVTVHTLGHINHVRVFLCIAFGSSNTYYLLRTHPLGQDTARTEIHLLGATS